MDKFDKLSTKERVKALIFIIADMIQVFLSMAGINVKFILIVKEEKFWSCISNYVDQEHAEILMNEVVDKMDIATMSIVNLNDDIVH